MKRLLTALLVATSAISAHAAPIHFSLHDAAFDDGTSFSGSFDVDSVDNTLSNYSISVLDGELPAFTYDTTTAPFHGQGFYGPSSYSFSAGVRYIHLTFDQPLTTAGTYSIGTSFNSWDCNNCSTVRYVTNGYVTAADDVPEPAMLGLFGLGAVGLGLSRRRKS